MNPKDEITPEEKLLRLIRRSSNKVSKGRQTDQLTIRKEGESSKPTPSSADFNSSKLKDAKIIFAGIKSVNFILINRLIIIIVLVALAWFLYDLYFYSQQISKPLYSPKSGTKIISLKEREIKPYSYYQQEISKRNLFKAELLEPESKKVVPAGSTFKELIKSLKLLGIVSGDSPQVIIEDNKLQKTYFLHAGDYLGEIKIEEIYSDRATLEFKGERVSLFL